MRKIGRFHGKIDLSNLHTQWTANLKEHEHKNGAASDGWHWQLTKDKKKKVKESKKGKGKRVVSWNFNKKEFLGYFKKLVLFF